MSVGTPLVLALALALTGAAPSGLAGHFALATGAPRTAARLVASPVANDALARRLDIAYTAGGNVVRRYDVDMTKLLHLIVVDDEFRSFAHVHPPLAPSGHFTIEHRFPHPGLYHVYADAAPAQIGQQVFRFDLPVGDARAAGARDVTPTGRNVAAGPYRVALDSTSLRAAGESVLRVRVTKNGKLANDLHPYLGALAHAVFLDAASLAYVHVHPLPPGGGAAVSGTARGHDMPGMPGMTMDAPALPPGATSSPVMLLHVAVARPGTYKLWLQFRGGSGLYVAPFVVRAS